MNRATITLDTTGSSKYMRIKHLLIMIILLFDSNGSPTGRHDGYCRLKKDKIYVTERTSVTRVHTA